MTALLTEEQEDLRRTVREFLDDRSPESEVRRLMGGDPGHDPAVWKQLAGELGVVGLAIPEEYGGAGYGWAELAVVFEEAGRSLLCAPLLASAGWAAPLLLATGDAGVCADLLPGIASGDTVATVALTEESGRWDEGGVTSRAVPDGAEWRLDGRKAFVLDGHVADLLVVVARTPEGVGVFAVRAEAEGLRRERVSTMDQTRSQAIVELAGVRARLVGDPRGGWAAVERGLQTAAVALACEQVGGAQRTLDMTVAYAKVRHQYGRPIGSFQAIKHMCADMLLQVESARSAAAAAVEAADDPDGDLAAVSSLAKAFCSDAYRRVTADAVQIHGGIGFTWEHPAHLYFKRAASSAQLLGSADRHRELFAARSFA